ncbi:MAG: flagellar basal body rod protein FlgB [Alphaproteobacteria bacterium]|nr:flagellar basal body rod protein FlgB [Alphaproteobacteria bacterium]
MAISDTPLVGMLTQKMDWLTQRQRVLAQNIANADTPGYRARDIEPIDFDRALKGQQGALQLAVTSPAHVTSASGQESFRSVRNRSPYEVAPAGNQVVIEEQMMRLSETAGDFELTTGLYRKYMGLYRMALGRSGG